MNDMISDFTTKLVGVKQSLYPCVRTEFMSRIDLKRAFKQLFRSISQLHLLATVVDDKVFIDATMSMGLRNTCKLFEEDFMKAFVKGLLHHHPALFSDDLGPLVDNYLDDIWFLGESTEKNMLQILVAEFWAKWLGIELNDGKRELPRSETRHLGFIIDLRNKVLSVTDKHKRKIIAFFKNMLRIIRNKGAITVRSVQKLLGVQIWISTVFRVSRQFLTSTCDVLRVSAGRSYFSTRTNTDLVKRLIFDFKFWRRFILDIPKASFDFFLGLLPENNIMLSSDASTSWGMAGVMRFQKDDMRHKGFGGIFWQLSWTEWADISPTGHLKPGNVKINVAEFLAALITCETFASYCRGRYTTLEIDNTAAKSWLDSARCPRFPFDRCAQGVHLYMLKCSMKIKASWIPSEANTLADICSRELFTGKTEGYLLNGVQLLKVAPKWVHVLRFL